MRSEMRRRLAIEVGAVVWGVVGSAVALGALPHVNSDARWAVGIASLAFPMCALVAAVMLRSGRDRLAGLLLLLSVATPTYFAYVLNLPALIVGMWLVLAPKTLAGQSSAPSQV
jgi:hypothetical protein